MTALSGINQLFLIDSSVLIAVQRQELSLFERLGTTTVYLSVIVLGELEFGARISQRVEENLAAIDMLLVKNPVLGITLETTSYFAKIKANLRSRGFTIPDHDVWIAAQAIQHDLTLITRDAHFQRVEGLTVTTW